MITANKYPRISIIVATYNRGVMLARTLESLAAMELDKKLWEAVIVNNNSTDDTAEVFEKFAADHPDACNIRMVFEPRQGLSHARNRGISESRADILAVIDDDELVNSGFAEDYLAFFDSHPDAAAAGGKMIPVYEAGKPVWMSKYTEVPVASAIDYGQRVKPFPVGKNPFGGNMAFRRKTLEVAGLFDPKLGRTGAQLLAGEEKELFERIRKSGGKIYWVPTPAIRHLIPPERLTDYFFERVNYMGGVSERRRTMAKSRWAYTIRILREVVLWVGSLAIAAGYVLTGRLPMARYLLRMRLWITKGLLCGETRNPVKN